MNDPTMFGDPLFARAIVVVLKNEGGLVDDPRDPGGVTNFGIAARRHPEIGEAAIRAMTKDEATKIYWDLYWSLYHWRELPAPIAVKAFDASVVDGAMAAIKCLQRACRAAGRTVVEDGVLAIDTIGAAGYVSTPVLLGALKSELAGHFRGIIAARPTMARFRDGWLNRAYQDP
jgi:lysozyme family protein